MECISFAEDGEMNGWLGCIDTTWIMVWSCYGLYNI